MKVKFLVKNGANIHSCKTSGVMDTVKDLGLDDGEWESMSEDDKFKCAMDWANEHIEVWYEEQS